MSFARPGNRFQQTVAAAQDADEETLEQPRLADDHLAARFEEDLLECLGRG